MPTSIREAVDADGVAVNPDLVELLVGRA